MHCPYANIYKQNETEAETADKANPTPSSGRYVPPHSRGGDSRLTMGNLLNSIL